MADSFVSLNELARRRRVDPRRLAADLAILGVTPDAELESDKRRQALYRNDRVRELAALLAKAAV